MNQSDTTHGLYEREKKLTDELREIRPELFVPKRRSSSILLQHIGIDTAHDVLPKGCLKYLPFDFIVEEIRPDGSIITIDKNVLQLANPEAPDRTIYANLVKNGISTIEATNQLVEALQCDPKQLSYAGIKDAVAITAQKISFRDISFDALSKVNLNQLFLKNASFGKGVVTVGDLKGNRFTILIRTDQNATIEHIEQKVKYIASQGLYNYYGPQRFGSPRFLSHEFGKSVLRGDYKQLVRDLLVHTSEFEWPLVSQLRTKAAAQYGTWEAMISIYEYLPYTFRYELELLKRLKNWNGKGDQYAYAVVFAPEQIDIWAKSYASFLANKLLSRAERGEIVLPNKLPLLLNTGTKEQVQKLYGEYLVVDGTSNFMSVLLTNSYIKKGENSFLDIKMYPTVHAVKSLPEGTVLSFDLPKGAYATTLLYALFDICDADQISISKKYIDTKEELGMGTLNSVLEWVEPYVSVPYNHK